MARIINIKTISDDRGNLNVLETEKEIPFQIKRIFYIYDIPSQEIVRGGHRHKRTKMALICIHGSCEIYVNNGEFEEFFPLDNPQKCLILETEDWHTMQRFSNDAVLLVLASEYYDINDYIDEEYK